ncbi:DUF2815 family protein [Castellaniella caeni]|uniref:DUF2815 family protein n=1 Tax=Castellaniella caeni TaxID=266123 RepID=UPI000C9F2AB9|nr:DUF2815 family protein [Castellaniella caeni]
MQVTINNVRLAFPSLFEAKTVNGEGKPAFSGSFLIDPAHPQLEAIRDIIKTVAKEKWADKADSMLKSLEKQDKTCLHDGDLKDRYDGFPGNFYISARSATRPTVIGHLREPIVEADGKVYAGCYVNVSLDIWAQDNNYGKRINASLRGVQFLRDGDAFAGGGAADLDEFSDISEGADAEFA